MGGTLIIVGGLVALTLFLRVWMKRFRSPAMVSFIILGFSLRLAHDNLGGGESLPPLLDFLGGIGIVALLFRIGLDSDLAGLARQLKNAFQIWFSSVAVTALGAWLFMRYVLDADTVASLFVAVALSATSIGVSMGTWIERGALKSKNGERLLDAAELDDISSIILLALLLAIAPQLTHAGGWPWQRIGELTWQFVGKFTVFAAACAGLAVYADRLFSHGLSQILSRTETTVLAVAVAIVVAGVAEWIGFSLAIGALFAGFALSRNRLNLDEDHAQQSLHDLFVPFFFISVGFSVAPDGIVGALDVGMMLLGVAVATKFVGTALPVTWIGGARAAALLGVSMIPRAEITMIVARQGLEGGYLSQSLFAALVVVSLSTCILAPAVLQRLMERWKVEGEA